MDFFFFLEINLHLKMQQLKVRILKKKEAFVFQIPNGQFFSLPIHPPLFPLLQ